MNDSQPSKFLKPKSFCYSFLLCLHFFFASFVYGQSLSGNYTIGGSSPNYSSISSAVSDLSSKGVSGPVIFNIHTGTYSEKISISAVSGASSINTITFQSESGTNTDVTLSYANASSSDYVIQLNGADYIQFKNMTIQSTGSSYGRVIIFTNNADYNTFYGNKIIGITASSSYKQLVYSSSSYNNKSNQFNYNTFENGSNAFEYWGKSSSYASEIVISNNTFSGQSSSAISMVYASAPVISQNNMDGNNNSNNFGAIELHSSYGAPQIDRNKITGLWRYGIYLQANTGYSSGYGLVSNNFIQIGGSGVYYCYGIYIDGQTYTNIYHNNINITSGTTVDYHFAALYIDANYTASYLNFYNNIFANTAGGYAIYIEPTLSNVACNYNNLYTSGYSLAYWVSSAKNTLTDWQSATTYDANSYSVNPSYSSSTDLHVASSTLNDAGTPLTEVTTDIDGASRSTTTPDIGADEFQSLTNDAALLSFTSPTIPFASGSQSVQVTLFNNGINTISSVTIAWIVNGVSQTNYSWTGSLSSGASTTATLGNYTFNAGTAYTIEATVSSPNASTDTKNSNNSITSSSMYAAYSGTYTIGSSGADFSSLGSAITGLQNGGMVGAVTLSLQNGSYSEQVSIPQISGASSSNTLTIQSQSGNNTDVTISASGSSSINYIIQLNGADYVTIKNIKLQNTGTSYSRVIEFTNNANYNTIDNCLIYGGTTGTSSNLALLYSGSSYLNENNTITNNAIQTGSYGIYYAGTSSIYASGISISNNTISNVKYRGVYIVYANAAIISQNNISGYSYTSFYGIYVPNCSNGVRIEKNKITGGYGYGMYLSNLNGTSSDYALVANNFIQVGGTSSACRGIYLSSSAYIKLYYNNINITGSSSSATSLYLYSTGLSNLIFYNNIFVNSGGGYVLYASSSSLSTSSLVSDYNNLYKTGSNLAYWGGSAKTDLSAWKSATGFDTHSISSDPSFTSSTDLHTSATEINNIGTPVSEVSTDIDGEARNSTTPDIGADELALESNDAGLLSFTSPVIPFAAGLQTITVTLLNNSSSTLSSASISWSVNGVSQTTYNWTGSISAGSSASVNIGTYNFILGAAYSVSATVSSPNGGSDSNSSNDAISTDNLYAAYGGTYTIGSSGATFSSLTDAITKIQYGGLLSSVTLNMQSGTYNEQVSISEIPGASSTNTLTFQPASGINTDVIISYGGHTNAANYVILLNAADYLIFKNLTIQSTGSSYGRVIAIEAGANNNSFDGNNLIGLENINSVVYCYSGVLNQYNEFTNNTIQYGDYGIYYFGQSSSSKAAGITISNNTILE
jgi:hypothetical protein